MKVVMVYKKFNSVIRSLTGNRKLLVTSSAITHSYLQCYMHLHVHVSVVYNQHMVSRKQITMKCILLSKYVQCSTNYYYDCYYYHYHYYLFRYDHEDNKKVESVVLKEVRGNFGKGKWPKGVIKGMHLLMHIFYYVKMMYITVHSSVFT